MSRKNVRVDIPVDEPDDTLGLCKAINNKHIALGVGSPLAGYFNMADFSARISQSFNLRASAKIKEGQSQSKYNQCASVCGIAEGQNKQTTGTLYVMTLSIRDYLLLKFRATPEDLSLWGYSVVVSQTGGRRNVRVNIPDSTPDELLALCKDINTKHIADGVGSILLTSEVNMTDFDTLLTQANTLITDSNTLRDEKESENNQAINIIGYGEGQTAETPGTLYNYITGMRERLLNKYAGAEEQLSEWGYNVVITESSVGVGEEEPTPP